MPNCQYEMSGGPCNAPIVPNTESYTGWEHEHTKYELNGHEHKVWWLHWASPTPYGGEQPPDFLPCAVCDKRPDENPAHFLFESNGGHKYRASQVDPISAGIRRKFSER